MAVDPHAPQIDWWGGAQVASTSNAVASPATSPSSVAATDLGPDLAIRSRLNAAALDYIIVVVAVVGLVLATGADAATTWVRWAAPGINLAYRFIAEALYGQTIGKRRYGVKVIDQSGGRASVRQIAIRTVLLPFDFFGLFASALFTMWRTGPRRRQRIGDFAAGTLVVPAGASRAILRPRPSLLPLLTVFCLVVSGLTAYAIVSRQQGAVVASSAVGPAFESRFIGGCAAGGTNPMTCRCMFELLRDRHGYTTVGQWVALAQRTRLARATGNPGLVPRPVAVVVRTCKADYGA
jgi:uncharacterized RDD family membrane protein YckC